MSEVMDEAIGVQIAKETIDLGAINKNGMFGSFQLTVWDGE